MCQGSDLGTVINLSACFRLYATPTQAWNQSFFSSPLQMPLLSFSFFSLSNFHLEIWYLLAWDYVNLEFFCTSEIKHK